MIFKILKNKLNKFRNNKKLPKKIIVINQKIRLKIQNQLFPSLNQQINLSIKILKRRNKFKNKLMRCHKQKNKTKIMVKLELEIFPD